MALLVDARASASQTARRFFSADERPLVRVGRLLGALVVVAGVVLRFYAPTALWLDETISVNISKLSLTEIPRALSHDGSPPLYYYLLHFWMLVFGRGDFAVRALSGVTSVASLPFFWYAGRRVGGRRTAWAALLLAASSPFAIDYATSVRMYSQMILLCVLGFLAVARALEAPTRGRLVAVGAVTAALLYTHYWAVYLVAVMGVWLLWRIRRSNPRRSRTRPPAALTAGDGRVAASSASSAAVPAIPDGNYNASVGDRSAENRGMRAVFAAVVIGCVCWLPGVPTFLFQTLHTGTPWSSPASPADALQMFTVYSGSGPWAVLLSLLLFALIVFGLFGQPVRLLGRAGSLFAPRPERPGAGFRPERPGAGFRPERPGAGFRPERPGAGFRPGGADGREAGTAIGGFDEEDAPGSVEGSRFKVVLDLRLRPVARPLLFVLAGTVAIAIVGGIIANAAFVARYTAVVLPLFILIAALGLTVFADRRVVSGLLGVACLAGLLTGLGNNGQQRTQAVQVAAVLNAQAQPGDLVVYCPDQFGPAVDRLLRVPDVTEVTFPRAIGPQRVDWVNYRKTIDNTDVGTFAQQMLARLASGHTLWLVYRDGYPGFGGDCGYLYSWFNLLRPPGETVVAAKGAKYFEYENLVRFST